MATPFPRDHSKGMIERVRQLIFNPVAEWQAIDAEPMTAKGIFLSWVVPLAAIGPIAGLIGAQVFGYGLLGVTYRPSIIASVEAAVIHYVSSLVGIFVLALVIDALAPNFGAAKNPVSAMKVAAFSATAALIVGVVQIVPALAILGLAGFYSLYLMWIGLPLLMKPPADKAVTYYAVTLAACVVLAIIVGAVTTTVAGSLMRPMLTADAGAASGTVSVPGLGSVDLDKMKAAGEKMKAASAQMQADAASGHSSAVPVDALQGMLPASIAGFTRGDVETQSGGAAGINGSKAEAQYKLGDQSFRLSVADIGAMGAVATLGGAINAQSSKTTATGYEKSQMVDGSMVSEKWDNADHSGSYSTMVASRFAVDASGNAPSIDVLKQAVAAIDTGKLAGLAK